MAPLAFAFTAYAQVPLWTCLQKRLFQSYLCLTEKKSWHIQSLICSNASPQLLYGIIVNWWYGYINLCVICNGNIFCCFPLYELKEACKCWIVEAPEWSPGVLRLSFSSAQMCNHQYTQGSHYHLDLTDPVHPISNLVLYRTRAVPNNYFSNN